MDNKEILDLMKKSEPYIDSFAAAFDNIVCTNCGYDGVVNVGVEKCPACKEDGTLKWKDENDPEVTL